ncbi:MAG: type II toxin-antitoxin system RelE/ParE family toxin [Phascolarctobacterium sp.]|nr:type II toxin-antitoxin system RelE/ParE family toxin [Phascolarctobacterium sp.]
MTKPKQYKIIYKQVFQKELSSIVNYILYALRNRNAARSVYKNVISAIESRADGLPNAFEVVRFVGATKEYYRIYVNNYVVYYSLVKDTMVVEHIFYSKQNVLEVIK